MNRPEWEQVEALFAQALEQPSEERAAFVAAAGAGDPITSEVLALLAAHDRRGPMDSIADRLHSVRPTRSIPTAELIAQLQQSALGERYQIERELGRGGMAIVLLAEDLKHHRKVALKVLQPDLALSLGPARFLQEIAIAARLAHPHILPLYDSGDAGGLLYYVMPYVDGESLRARLKRDGPLPLDDALRIIRQIADALAYAHSRQVVHRDVKPENILLEAGHAVVSDFGIARAMTAAGGQQLSDTGVILGTPAYMSPEQALGRKVDGRTDIYSLGCLLFEMLAGAPPFVGKSSEAVLRQQISAPVPPLSSAGGDVPEAVTQAVTRALQKSPRARFAVATEFADALPLPGAPPARVRGAGGVDPARALELPAPAHPTRDSPARTS